MRDYKEDSTKGKAHVLPVNYKGDVLAQAWVDARKLAVLSKWLDRNDFRTRHLSEVIKYSIDVLVDKLVESGVEQMVEFTKDAREILKLKYRADLNPGGRGHRNMLHNMHLDEIRVKGMRGDRYEVPVSGTLESEVRELTERGVEMYYKMEKERKFKDQQVSKVDHSKFEYDENGVFKGFKKGGSDKPAAHLTNEQLEESVRRMKEADEKLKEM